MEAPKSAYLVTNSGTGKKRLIAAAAPANAIAHCAKDMFAAQRVDGAVLETLLDVMELEHVTVRSSATEEGEAPAGETAPDKKEPATK